MGELLRVIEDKINKEVAGVGIQQRILYEPEQYQRQ